MRTTYAPPRPGVLGAGPMGSPQASHRHARQVLRMLLTPGAAWGPVAALESFNGV